MRSLFMRSLKVVVFFLASTVCFAAQADRIAGPIGTGPSVALAKSQHPKAQPQYDQGAVDPAFQLGYVTLVFAPSRSQQAALDQLLAQQQDRSSPNYRRWLTPEQYADRFGLSRKDIKAISSWLVSQGFAVVDVPRGRNAVIFGGNAAQIAAAFKTEIHRYNVNGEKHIANSTPVFVPGALSGIATSIRGLTDFRPKPMYVRPVPSGRGPGPHPRFTTTIQQNTEYFLAPGDLATIYDISPLYNAASPINGAGQKLAIIGQTDVYLADLVDFRSSASGFNLPSFTCTTGSSGLITSCDSAYFQYILVGADEPVSLGDLFESDLDLEWSGAIARNAQIVFVNAPVNVSGTSGGVNVSLAYAIENDVAPVISMSYGLCEAEADSLETELAQANSEGITVLNSSGDTGSAICDYSPPGTTGTSSPNPPYAAAQFGLAVSYPASSPEVTGVGGTSIPAADFTSAYWNSNGSGTTANGGSALSTLIGTEQAWNDDEALGTYCLENPGPAGSFCDPSPGVAVTSAQTLQEDYWISIGGGGVSNCSNFGDVACTNGFPRPPWQQSLTIPNLTSPQSTYRFVPDVSLLASPNFPGYVICTPVEELSSTSPYDTETTSSCASGVATAADGVISGENFAIEPSIVGGTSASSPIFAGIVALLNQYAGGSGLGNINPSLYSLAASPSNGIFHSVKSGDNDVYCHVGEPAGQPSDVICPSSGVIGFSASNFDSTTGYNLVAGLGSVDVNNLATALAPPDFQLSAGALSPASVPAGQSTSSTLTISAISGSTPVVVNFSPSNCSGLPTGATCSFLPQSVTFDGTNNATTVVTITTLADMAASGPTTVTITPTNSPQTTAQINLTVGATNESFTLTTTATTFPVTAGGTATLNVTVMGAGSPTNFVANNVTALPITYTCTSSPALSTAEISCQISPGNSQPTSATAITVSLVTTPKTAALRPIGGSNMFYAMLLPGLFGVVFAASSKKRGTRLLSLFVVLGLSTMWMGACGGSGSSSTQSNPGTPAGSYSVTINATTGGASPLTASLPITLTVSAQ